MPPRRSITLAVIPASGRAQHAGRLTGLESELSEGDNLVVLGRGLARSSQLWRVVSNGRFERAGALPRLCEIVVFLDEQSELSKGAINELVAVLDENGVAATAPLSNTGRGEELLVGVPYRPYETEKRAEFLEGFAAATGLPRLVERLAGPCLAMSSRALGGLPGLEAFARRGHDLDALCLEVGQMGALALCPSAYVHHKGGHNERLCHLQLGTSRLVSACLIVKDESDNLERCFGSIRDVADEIVVYDTGSSDDTVELATRLGARVVTGYWDDDFSRARNDALSHCRGEWILWIDADEALSGDPRAVRAELMDAKSDVEGFVVTIDNLRGSESSTMLSHPACRIFRRSSGMWDGRVHEQVVARAGTRELFIVMAKNPRLTHWGYVQSALSEKDKAKRNLRSAFGDLGGGSALSFGDRLTSLSRSYLLAGRFEEGIDLTTRAIALADRPPAERLARRALIEGLLAAGRPEEALVECRRLEEITEVPTLAHAHAGAALNALGRHEEALFELGAVVESTDEDGFSYNPDFVASEKAEALAGLDRHDEAATLLLRTLRLTGGLDVHLGHLVEHLDAAGRDLSEIAASIEPERYKAFVPQLLQLTPGAADRVLEVLHAAAPDNLAVLAAASNLGAELLIDRQLIWSARLRARDLDGSCPLVATTVDTGIDVTTRLVAAASAYGAFKDLRASQAIGALALGLRDDEREGALAALEALAPGASERARSLHPATVAKGAPHAKTKTARPVLVVCRSALELRAYALAARLSAHGHAVTLLQAQPAAPAEELLAPHGVTVRAFRSAPSWQDEALKMVAHLYASDRFDVVIATSRAEALVADLGRLLPVAQILLESESTSLGRPAASWHEDLELLFGELPFTPEEAREGIVVVGDLAAEEAARTSLTRHGPMLSRQDSVAFVGDDPERLAPRTVPGIIPAGPLANPTWWVRSARCLVLLGSFESSTWRDLAELCATPVIDATSTEPDELEDLVTNGVPRRFARSPGATREVPSRVVVDLTSSEDPLEGLPAPYRRGQPRGLGRVGIVGSVYSYESLATVNRELALRLERLEDVELTVYTGEQEPSPPDSLAQLARSKVVRGKTPAGLDLEIRHQFPPDFSPSSARLVLIQPWEFGGLPAEWIGPLRDVVDELWVPTNFVRDCAIESGVDAERVQVVPNGVDTDRLSPEGEKMELSTTKSTRLLFVGGLIDRKGIDVLLETYYSSFSAADDVCLVIKPFGSNGVYRNATLEPVARRLAEGDGPEIEFVDEHLTAAEMASLYRACDVLVHPYRGEGFALPVAEAMSCGLPVVVTNAGACLDFCDESVAYLVEAHKRPLDLGEFTPSAGGTYWFEPSRASLADALRAAVDDPAERARRGSRGRKRILERFTWDAAAAAAARRVEALLERDEEPVDLAAIAGVQ